jgi:hypothetical protein
MGINHVLTALASVAEIRLCEKLLKDKRVEIHRMAVRMIRSSFDSMAFAMKNIANAAANAKELDLSPADRQVLFHISEPTFEDGPPPRRTNENVRAVLNVAINTYARARDVEPPLETSPIGTPALPSSFLVMEKVHDRLIRPQDKSDLEVSREELKALRDLLKWVRRFGDWLNEQYQNEIEETRERIHKSMQEQIDQLQRQKE